MTTRQKIKNILLSEVNWKNISRFFINHMRKLKHFGKVHGVGLLGFAVVTNILQLVVPPLILPFTGVLGSTIAFMALGNGPTIFYHKVATFYSNRRKLRQFFQGNDNLEKFKVVMNKVYEKLSLDSLDDLIIPLPQDKINSIGIKVSNENLFNRTLKYLGFRKNTLNYATIEKFINDENISNRRLKLFAKSKNLTNSQKSFITLIHLNNIMTTEQSVKFHSTFSSFIVENHTPDYSQSLINWVDKVMQSKTARDLISLFDDIPSDVRPFEIAYIWERVVMPELAERDIVFNMLQFRNLTEKLPSIQADIFNNKRNSMDFVMKKKFKSYIQNSMKGLRTKCYRSHDDIIKYLIQKTPSLIN